MSCAAQQRQAVHATTSTFHVARFGSTMTPRDKAVFARGRQFLTGELSGIRTSALTSVNASSNYFLLVHSVCDILLMDCSVSVDIQSNGYTQSPRSVF